MADRRRFGSATVVAVVGIVGVTASCESFAPAPTSSPAGTPGAPPAEDCLDGRDDNDDGKRDCEEPSCAPYVRCVPGPGALGEWTGYFTLVEGGDCPADVPNGADVWAASSEGASCAECKCAPTISCDGKVNLDLSTFATCNPTKPIQATVGACESIPDTAAGPATQWYLGDFGVKKCAPSSDPPKLPAKFARARLCSNARIGGGCPQGQVCAARSSGGSGAGACVSRSHGGGPPVPCPEGFPVAHLVVPGDRAPETSFSDQRSCSDCTCGPATGASCNGVLSLFSDATCTNLVNTVKGGSCTNISCGGKGCPSGRIDVTAVPGTCAPGGGMPTGAVDLAGAGQQLCCER